MSYEPSININQYTKKKTRMEHKKRMKKKEPKRREKTSCEVVKRLSRSVKEDDAEDDGRTQRTTGARACDARDGWRERTFDDDDGFYDDDGTTTRGRRRRRRIERRTGRREKVLRGSDDG